jgi:amino acid adenylation domain-containing protein
VGSEDECEQLLHRWNDTASEFPDGCVHELFEQQATRHPDAIAVVGRGQQLSYGELNRRANQLAHHLRRRGVGPESLVGVCLERSPEMVAALLGVWKAGGAYVPLDASYPPERLAFMVSDADVHVLLTEERCRALFSNMDDRIICLDSDWPEIRRGECENFSSGADANNLAYVIYTSGSTGKPKGAMILHRGLVNYLWWAIRAYGVRKGGSVPLHSSISFDLTVTSLYPALLTGATVELLAEDVGAQSLLAALRRKDRDLVKITPAHLELLGQQLGPEEVAGMTNVFVIGGENLLADGLRLWRGSAPETRLINEYGPTETVVGCCVYEVRPEDPQCGPVPIGRPIANTQLYILDEAMRPVPVGTTGELYIGGVGVARGYLNRPELTAERFLPDPFSGRANAFIYKTGDLARYRPDGVIEYLGRTDDQVKIQGYRIELGEIEAVLACAPSVQSCVVLAREDVPGEKVLVAYLVPGSEQALSAAELQAHLHSRLPEYMVPTKFVSLASFPLTQNGKIDRRALPVPSAEIMLVAREMVLPRSATEMAVAAIFSEVLNVEHVGIHDDFFDLGGRSLLAIRAVSRLRDLFGAELAPELLFEKPTVAELAALLTSEQAKGKSAQHIEPRKQEGPGPLSFAQQPLWFIYQFNPDSPVYNILDVVRFGGACDVAALRGALQELVRRHEMLRTYFSECGDQPVQAVLPAMEMGLAETDLSSLPDAKRERAWRSIVWEEGRKPFDLTTAPLLRARLVHWGREEHRLLVVIHHILADEWSMEVIQRELHALYSAFAQGEGSPLPELAVQYTDYALWNRQVVQGELLESQLAFWKKELEGAPFILELPTDKPRPATQSFRGATEIFSLPGELLQALKAMGRQEQATLFMTLEASFAALLYRYTGQNDVLVGTPISGRTLSDTENLIGCFLNMVVLRSQLTKQTCFRSLLRETRERALRSYAHPALPFDQLVAELARERDPSHTPLFQAMFVLHDSGGISQVSKVLGNHELETGTSKFDLTMVLCEAGESLDGLIEYSTDLFEAETIRSMCMHYATLLAAMVREPDRAISGLAMLPPGENHKLQVEWNATAADFPRELCLHLLLAEQVARAPERVAAVFGNESLSYAELDRRSSRLAQHLRSLGAGPDVLLGLLTERSLEMLVGLLGILKAGSAYVPLDPAFPKNRLAYMVEDSRMQLLVTHRGLEQGLSSLPPIVVRMDADASAIAASSDAAPSVAGLTSQHLAYVIYTSGSTGRPKGVAIPHAAIVNFLVSMRQAPGFGADDTLLAVTTLSFDIAGLELYLPLLFGGKVVLASSTDAQDPRRLIELISSSRCTVLQATPATFRALIDAGWTGSARLKLLCGGEALAPDLAAGLLARCGELWNMYGPTETTVWSSLQRVRSAEGPISIGRPIANTQLYVLDAHRNLAPTGTPGELYIGGEGLARGYLHREDLTRERFVLSPFSAGERLYRTGDLARWRRDGTMECLGRVDNQVKVRGFRIELGEIESILNSCPGVRQCAVILRADATGGPHLAAYYECQVGASPSVAELRAHLAGDLPGYMVPGAFVALNRLPLTPNGKINRKALAASTEHIADERQFVPPRNELEHMLAQIWARVLKVGRVGVEDNFFELGGHSLLAVRVIMEIEKFCHIRVPLAALLQTPTIAALAASLAERSWKPSWRSLVPLRAEGSRPPLFLMHAHGGNTLEYHALADLLQSGQPVYALQARGLDGHIVRDSTIEEMAAAYIEEIRSVQGEGPFYLAGFCFGGLLALETAQQLTAAGHEVPLLILIQSMHPRALQFRPGVGRVRRAWYKAAKRLSLELENLSSISYRGAGYALERFRFLFNRLHGQAALRLAGASVNGNADLSHLPVHSILEAIGEEHGKAAAKYVPRPYAGKVLLFRASKQQRGLMVDDLLGWGEILRGEVEATQVPGHQQNMLLRPNVTELATQLASSLEAAQWENSSSPISI